MEEPDAIGRRIDRARRARGFSYRALAEMAHVPLSTIYAVCRGQRDGGKLTLETGGRLAKALLVSLDWLVGLTGDDGQGWPPPLDFAGQGVGVSIMNHAITLILGHLQMQWQYVCDSPSLLHPHLQVYRSMACCM